MRWKPRPSKYERHSWFAWYPVYDKQTNDMVLFEYVYRQLVSEVSGAGGGPCRFDWEYTSIPDMDS